MMVTKETRNEVWDQLIDATRLARYYDALASRYRQWHSIVKFFLLLFTLIASSSFLNLFPVFVHGTAAVALIFLITWDFTFEYAEKAAVLHTISMECSKLEVQWRELWAAANTAGAEDDSIYASNQQLIQHIIEVTGRTGYANIPPHPKINQQCTEEAYQVLQARYVT